MNGKMIWAVTAICIAFGLTGLSTVGKADAAGQTVLATTFPIYQIVRNVTRERAGVTVALMVPSQLGCPHDYVLTPQDMQKLANADILVINGLGMEEFLGAPVKKANPRITVIDSSIGIKETLPYSEARHPDHGHAHLDGEDHPHHDHDPPDAGVNPHLFAGPRMSARIAMNIAAELSKTDPNGAAVYFKNAQAYAESMNNLADEMAALGKRLKNNRIVQPHGVFEYLARDMGLEIVAILLPHGHAPAAAEMMQLIKDIKAKRAGAIFTEPQYPEKVGKTLSKETGIPVAMLDPAATGPENAPLAYYETVMRENMKILASTLGVK